MVAVNNPSLWVTPGDPKSQRFHLAFTARVEESGAFTLQQWWSSSGAVSLAILVGRELVMEVDANGRVGLRDPNLPENNEEVKAAIKAAISRIIGACDGCHRAGGNRLNYRPATAGADKQRAPAQPVQGLFNSN